MVDGVCVGGGVGVRAQGTDCDWTREGSYRRQGGGGSVCIYPSPHPTCFVSSTVLPAATSAASDECSFKYTELYLAT